MEELLEDYHLLSILQRHLDLNDIMNLTLVNSRLYSIGWRVKMQNVLNLRDRVDKRWRVQLPMDFDVVLWIRGLKRRALEHVSSTAFFNCWVAKCPNEFTTTNYAGEALANRRDFKHTTCKHCALEILKEHIFLYVDPHNFLIKTGKAPGEYYLEVLQAARYLLKEYTDLSILNDWYYDKRKLK